MLVDATEYHRGDEADSSPSSPSDQRTVTPSDPEGGQATAEYALVLLGAAAVAVLFIAWAASGGGAGKIGHLLDAVLDAVISKVH